MWKKPFWVIIAEMVAEAEAIISGLKISVERASCG